MYNLTKRKGRKVQISYDGGKTWKSTGFDTKEQAFLWLSGKHDRKLKEYAKDFFMRTDDRSYTFRKNERGKAVIDITRIQNQRNLDHYILKRFGEYNISEIKAREIDRWLITLKSFRTGKVLSSSTKNAVLSIFSQVLDMAVFDEIVETNEARKVENIAARNSKKKGLISQSELEKIFPENDVELVELYGTRRNALFFLILKDTGFRPGEILALRHEDIGDDGSVYTEFIFDCHTKTIQHRIKTSNSGMKYKVGFLSERAMRFLGAGNGYIFDYTRFTQQKSNRLFKEVVLKVLGRNDLTQYCLRHAFMTNLISKYPRELIMELMGHRQWEACYDDRTPEQVIDNLRMALNRYQVQ